MKLRVNAAENKVIKCNRDGNIGGNEVVLNGVTLRLEAKIPYLDAATDTEGSNEAEMNQKVGEGAKFLRTLDLEAKMGMLNRTVILTVFVKTGGMSEPEK